MTPRAALNAPPTKPPIGDRIAAASELAPEDLALVTRLIDALVTKTRLKVLASGS